MKNAIGGEDAQKTSGPCKSLLPYDRARWIWDKSDRYGYHNYLEARRVFSAGHLNEATLLITADAYYQIWLNGSCFGHGPSKSADGKRSVDCYDAVLFFCSVGSYSVTHSIKAKK